MEINKQKLKEIRGGVLSNGMQLNQERITSTSLDSTGNDLNNKPLCGCSGVGSNTNHALLCHCKDRNCNPT